MGPVYDRETAERLVAEKGWAIAADGDCFRRVVASPRRPQRIFELRPIRQLLERGTVVICAGGGGIPTAYDDQRHLEGIEAVIDKDLASSLLARELDADLLVIATDVDGVYDAWATPEQRLLDRVAPEELESLTLPAGSMGPKVQAACEFARGTGHRAVIGSLADIVQLVAGTRGTNVEPAPLPVP